PGGGEPVADAAEAGDDLVGDVETACLSYRFPDLLQVALRNGAYPPGTHHRLDEDSGDALGTGVLDRLLDGLGVVVWDDGDVADELSVAGPVRLDPGQGRSEEHTSELQSRENLVCRLLLEKKNRHV